MKDFSWPGVVFVAFLGIGFVLTAVVVSGFWEFLDKKHGRNHGTVSDAGLDAGG